jgi:two-component system alkaline phosphatase synthesis response regulator PhoP
MKQALVIEDDPDIVELVAHYLAREGWSVESVADGVSGLARIQSRPFDLLILDLQLPGLDGLSLCAEVRRDRRTQGVPIVILTARGDEADRIVGLEVGADDYVVKPFSPKELLARVRAVRRRVERREAGSAPLVFGELVLDREAHEVKWAGVPVKLAAKEFALLQALLEASGRVLSRRRLLEDLWGYSYVEGTRTVDVHIRKLREKLPGLAPSIVTVTSLGYKLSKEPQG